jgi:hypothetical protein
MHVVMFVIVDPTGETDVAAEYDMDAWLQEGIDRGVNLRGDRLRPAPETKTVRRVAGEPLVTDGPFTELTELIAGYDVLECADLDEAIDYASRHPMAQFGAIELRPVWPLDDA